MKSNIPLTQDYYFFKAEDELQQCQVEFTNQVRIWTFQKNTSIFSTYFGS